MMTTTLCLRRVYHNGLNSGRASPINMTDCMTVLRYLVNICVGRPRLHGRGLALLCLLLCSIGAAAEVRESSHGPWTLRCESAIAGQADSCILFQNLVLKTGGQTVLQFAIGVVPGTASPTVLVSLPRGSALPPGITIRIDDGKENTFPIERCEPEGCRAGMKLRDATVAQLSAGEQLEITFYDNQRQAIRMPLSLQGFEAGFAALNAATTPARSDGS